MTGPGRRFDPAELRGDGADVTDAELADALAMARELEALSARDQIGPTAGFEDRVMEAIAAEAPPRLVVRPAGRARPLAFLAAFGEAWRVATGGGRPFAVRAQAMAFVLLVVLATGSLASVAAIGAANLLSSPPGPTPRVVPTVRTSPTPVPTPSTEPTPVSPSPSVSPEATSSEEPGGAETDDPGASDDHGGTAEPGDDNGTETAKPAATPKSTKTPRPTRTPEAEETDEPEETPEPDETSHDDTSDDHGGTGSG